MKRFSILIAALCLCLTGCGKQTTEATAQIFAMDTVMEVAAYGEHAEQAVKYTEKRIEELENRLSRTKADSLVSGLNRDGSIRHLTYDYWNLVARAKEYRDATNGALWRRRPAGTGSPQGRSHSGDPLSPPASRSRRAWSPARTRCRPERFYRFRSHGHRKQPLHNRRYSPWRCPLSRWLVLPPASQNQRATPTSESHRCSPFSTVCPVRTAPVPGSCLR